MQSVFGSDFAFCVLIPPFPKAERNNSPSQSVALKFYPLCLLYHLSQIFRTIRIVKNLDISMVYNTFSVARKFSNCKFTIIFSHSVQALYPLLPRFPPELIICLQRANSYLKVKRMSFYTHPLTHIICLVMTLSRYACRA